MSELTTDPRKEYLSSFEFCGETSEELSWVSADAEPTITARGRSKYGPGSRLVVSSTKRTVLGNINESLCQFQKLDDSLQRL